MIPIRYNVQNLLARKATSMAAVGGIALVVFVLASSLMLVSGIKSTLGSQGSRDRAIVLRKGSDAELSSGIESPTVGLILAAPGVKKDEKGTPLGSGEVVVVVALEKVGTGGKVSNVQVRGVPERVWRVRPEARVIAGRPPRPGTDEVAIGKRIRGRYTGVQLGSSFEIKKNRQVSVVGVFAADGSAFESEVWGDLETVRSAFGRDGIVSSVTVRLERREGYDGFAAAVEHDKRLGLDARRETEYFERQSQNTTVFILGLGITIALFFSVGAMIGAMITFYGAVDHRSREIGTLRALGFTRFDVLVSFLAESFLLALAGGAVGALGAMAMGLVEFSMMNFVTWSEIVFRFEPTPATLAISVVAGGLMGLVGGFLPAVRAARVQPIEALRG